MSGTQKPGPLFPGFFHNRNSESWNPKVIVRSHFPHIGFRRSRSWREMPLLLRTSMEKRNMKKMALILTHLAGMAMISGVRQRALHSICKAL